MSKTQKKTKTHMKEIANTIERTRISEGRNPGIKYVDNCQ